MSMPHFHRGLSDGGLMPFFFYNKTGAGNMAVLLTPFGLVVIMIIPV